MGVVSGRPNYRSDFTENVQLVSEPSDRQHVEVSRCRGVGVSGCRGGGIRTHGLFVPNEARYQAAPHPVASLQSLMQILG